MSEIFLRTFVPLAGGIISFLLCSALLYRRIHRSMPLFVTYMGYYSAEGLLSAATLHFARRDYAAVYLGLSIFDLLLSLSVLVEIGRNVLRRNRLHTHNRLAWPAVLLAGCTLLLWPLVRWPDLPAELPLLVRIDLHFMQASTVVSTAAVVSLLVWSSLLKVHWPERELRIVMGMGIMVVVAFTVLIAYTDGGYNHLHSWLDLLTPVACVSVFLYWTHYFWLDPNMAAPGGSYSVPVPAGADEVGTRQSSDARDIPAFAMKRP